MNDRGQGLGSRTPLTCPEVLDTVSDTVVPSDHVLGQLDAVELHQLRLAAEEVKLAGRPRFRCPLCQQALGIRGGGPANLDGHDARSISLHFLHPRDPAHRCPYKTGGDFTPEQYEAMKYNGLKETRAHRMMKARLWSGLKIDPDTFPGTLQVERRFKAKLPDTSWRQPDVQVQWRDMSLVFEAQLATTFVTVIAQRRNFYRENGAQILWVFRSPPTEEFRFTTKDVVFNNNCNLFVVSEETTRLSIAQRKLVLQAWWPSAEDRVDGVEPFRWESEMVALRDLTFDESMGAIYYVDHEAEVSSIRLAREETKRMEELQRRGDMRVPPGQSGTLMLRTPSHPRPLENLDIDDGNAVRLWMLQSARGQIIGGLRDLVRHFQAVGRVTSLSGSAEDIRLRHFESAVRALMSLQEGEPIGTRLPNLLAVENWIWHDYRDHYALFSNAAEVWGKAHLLKLGDAKSTFRKHLNEWRANRRDPSGDVNPDYRQDTSLHPIFRAAFPELVTAINRIESSARSRDRQ